METGQPLIVRVYDELENLKILRFTEENGKYDWGLIAKEEVENTNAIKGMLKLYLNQHQDMKFLIILYFIVHQKQIKLIL